MPATEERSCPTCGHANRLQARFCEACGGRLESRCAACSNEIRAGARFCDSCGAPAAAATPASGGTAAAALPKTPLRDPRTYTPKHLAERILTSRSALEGERKQVTVLFADVKGSMELAEQVDPEEWHKILDRFFEILTEGVHRFEGTINQYTGDGVMALFGAPIAHEDHAHRACYAALNLLAELQRFAHELKQKRGLPFAVRMGINSGEVVVGRIGDDLRMDYTAQGQVVGVAARLQALADPGKAYLSSETAALVSGFFELESLGAFDVKGVSQPLRVFSLQGTGHMRTRLDASRARGLSRFVGRADETAALEAALSRAGEGHGQVVGVVAEAGTGKSRLCEEFTERCRSRGIAVRAGRGVAHGRLLAFHPLLELLHDVFGITERDSPREAQQKIAGALVLVDRRLEDSLTLFFEFLGVPDPDRPAPLADPADRKRQLFAAVSRLFRALGEREPSVILLEDLHWFDDGTAGFLESLMEAIAGTRTLVLANFRPEFRAPWMERSTYQQLPLLPLGAGALDELLDDLLGRDPSLEKVRDLVRSRAGGNPFFIEEIVQSLVESGGLEGERGAYRLVGSMGALRVPPTIQALLAARIDRLPERERRLLQTAAVVGKRFPESLLRHVAGLAEDELAEALRTLRLRDLVFEQTLFPKVVYAFKHPLTQEVAYGSQLAERRRGAHAAVARVLEKSDPARLEERAALLAHHWEAAGEPLPAARWHRRAAERAEMSSPETAAGHWRAVRRLGAEIADPGEGPGLRLAACVGLVRAADYDAADEAEARAAFEEGRQLALETGDRDSRVRLLLAYSALILQIPDFEQSARLLAEAESVAAEGDDPEIQFVVRGHAAFVYVLKGESLRALELYEEAFALLGDAQPRDNFVLRRYLGALANRWMMVAELGRLDEASREVTRLLAAAEAACDLSYQCIAHLCLNRIGFYRGDAREALRHALAGIDAAERLGVLSFRVGSRTALGGAHHMAGNFEEALAALDDADRLAAREAGDGLSRPVGRVSGSVGPNQRLIFLARLAETHAGLGNLDRALELSKEAAAVAGSTKRLGAADAFLARARILLGAPDGFDATEIERVLDAAAEVARHCAAGIYEPAIHEQRARLARRGGRVEEAEGEFREALRLYTEMGASGHAARLAAAGVVGERSISAA